mgnify:CR=1 FL=1
MECFICYTMSNSDNFVFLECSHSICSKCFFCLSKDLCPFCRFIISKNFKKEIKDRVRVKTKAIEIKMEPVIVVNFRQDSGIYHQIYNENLNLIVDFYKKKGKVRKQKDNVKRGRWAVSNYKNKI